jgi:CHAD domain-containing protein
MMARIKPTKALSDEVFRIARAQLEEAVDILYTERDGRDQAVHDARKLFKKQRGLYRLIRLGAMDFYRAENVRLRDAARSLSADRDATALVEALDRMVVSNPVPESHATLLAIRQRVAARRDSISAGDDSLHERISAVIATLERAIEALADLDLRDKPKAAGTLLAEGVVKTYARAIEAFKKARKTGEAEDWHELRKHLKYHWVHVGLLRAAWPGEMRLRAAAAKRAAEDIGEHHDLNVLLQLAENEPDIIGSEAEIEQLREATGKEIERLRARAAEACDVLLCDDPEVMQSRIQALLRVAAA